MAEQVFDMLEELATCLCAQIVTDGSPQPCFCGVVPGELALAQYISECDEGAEDCGMAWVRLTSAYPSVTLGQPNLVANNCGSGLAVNLDVGIVRCISVGDAQGDSPSQAELLEASNQQMSDMMTIRRAILCCPAVPKIDTLLTVYTPIGPSGAIVGGSWQVTVML